MHKRSEPTRRPQDLRGGHRAICREFWGPMSLRASLWGSREDTTCDSAGKESACNAGDLGSISGLGRSPGEGKGYALQYSGLENTMDCIVHGLAKSQTYPPLGSCGLLVGSDLLCTTVYPGQLSEDALAGLGGEVWCGP